MLRESGPLRFKAGAGAFQDIRKRGFAAERIGTIAGASCGAKWLVLSQLDRVIAGRVLPQLRGPVHLVGSSIGAWRFACHAQSDPLAVGCSTIRATCRPSTMPRAFHWSASFSCNRIWPTPSRHRVRFPLRMTPAHRISVWRAVIRACQALADDLDDVLDNQRLAARLEPL